MHASVNDRRVNAQSATVTVITLYLEMPLHTMAEDSQPNEQRQMRKGISNAPLIRLTSGSSDRRYARGGRPERAARGSATLSHRSRYPQSQASTITPSYLSGANALPTVQYPRSVPQGPQHAQAQHHRDTSFGPSARRLDPPKRPSTPQEDRQLKRNRIHPPNVLSAPHTTPVATTASSSSAMDPPLAQHNKTSMTLDLPPNCYSGVTGCKLSRRQYRECETRRLEQDGRIEIYHVEYMNKHMKFFFRTKPILETDSQSGLATIFANCF